MDENRPRYDLKAPGSSGSDSPRHLPGRGSFPGVDDHLVKPEVTRDEIIGGRRVVAFPAQPPHANQHVELDFLFRAHAAPGYQASTDLLTRHDEDSDFATDTCVYKKGVDPVTGARYLEEIAFEVVSEQNERLVTEKAVRMHRRGVRRIFAVWVKTKRVCEWSAESQNWRLLEAGLQIEDPCLVRPLAVAALLDAAAADNAVAEALIAKGNPAIRKQEARGKAQGFAEGKARGLAEGKAEGLAEGEARGFAKSILKILEARGIAVSEAQRQEIQSCQDPDRLDRWLDRAVQASSAEEITSEP